MKWLKGFGTDWRGRGGGRLGMALLVFAWGCAVEPPSAPNIVDFTLNIPVANDTTHIGKIIGDRDFLQTAPGGGMALNFSKEVGRAEVGDRLSLRPQELEVHTPVGEIKVPGQSFALPPILLSQLVGQNLPAGNVALIPGSQISTTVSVPLENIQSMVVREGTIAISLRNETPLTLTDMVLVLVDQGRGGAVVDQADLGTLAPRASAAGQFVLSGKEISGNLQVEVTGRSQDATDVTVTDDDRLEVSASLSDLVLLSVSGLIPPQEFSASQAMPFADDRVQVTRARISQGRIILRVSSGIVLLTQIDLSLDDLKKPDGSPNVWSIDLEQGESEDVVFDLTENDFEPINPLELRFSYQAHTVGAQTPAALESGQEIAVQALTEELVMSRVEGKLNQLSLPMPEVEREIGFPDGLNNLSLAGASLDIYFTSGIGFLADVNLVIRGVNKFGQEGKVDVVERFPRGSAENPVSTQVTVTRGELTPFINLLPSQLFIEPEVRVGDGREVEVIEPADWVSIDSVVFHTEPRLTVEDSTYIDVEPRDIGFRDPRTRTRIESGLDSAVIATFLENSMPIGVGVRLFVAPRKEEVFTNPIVTIPRLERRPFRVEAAPVDAQGHSAGTTKLAPDPYILEKERVVQFLQDPLYSGIRIYLPKTDGEVEVRATDFVNVQATLRLDLNLNEDVVKGE